MTEALRAKRLSQKIGHAVLGTLLAFGTALCFATGASAQTSTTFTQTNLVFSNVSGASTITGKTRDANLVNAWGVARSSTGPWWINSNGKGLSLVYDGEGNPAPAGAPLVVTIPGGSPTGIVFNGTKDFEIVPGQPATFIFVTEAGVISAWSPSSGTSAVQKVANSAVYKGATTALNQGQLFLYVANFSNGTIDVFDTNFAPVTLPTDAFTDTHIPKRFTGFAPFNVMNIGGRLFVTYAKQDDAKHDDVAGAGNGFVNVFNPDGTFVMQLKNGRHMNSPWGVALAPKDFGILGNTILVGNFGSGQIAAFDPLTGNFRGLMKGPRSRPIVIDGLWGLGFGNGATAGPLTTLFFAAGPNKEAEGLFGTLIPFVRTSK